MKRLIALVSTKNKTPEEVSKELMKAFKNYKKAQKNKKTPQP